MDRMPGPLPLTVQPEGPQPRLSSTLELVRGAPLSLPPDLQTQNLPGTSPRDSTARSSSRSTASDQLFFTLVARAEL